MRGQSRRPRTYLTSAGSKWPTLGRRIRARIYLAEGHAAPTCPHGDPNETAGYSPSLLPRSERATPAYWTFLLVMFALVVWLAAAWTDTLPITCPFTSADTV